MRKAGVQPSNKAAAAISGIMISCGSVLITTAMHSLRSTNASNRKLLLGLCARFFLLPDGHITLDKILAARVAVAALLIVHADPRCCA
jgi:hypothetical protein